MQESKRRFLRNGGLLGAFFAGAATPIVVERVIEKEAPKELVDSSVLKQLEEKQTSSLTIMSTYGEVQPPKPSNSDLLFTTMGEERLRISSNGTMMFGQTTPAYVPGTEKHVSVSMVPGPDGNLYIKVKDQWKKVLTS